MSKRPTCEGCGRPRSVCLCEHLVQRQPPFELVIWQDPDESRHPLSTAPLLQKSVLPSRLMVGDQFQPEQLLGAGWSDNTWLLYPLEGKEPVDVLSGTVPDSPPRQPESLLILDGTWRKVRRLLHLNPWLKQLPHLSLVPQGLSQYRIRKSPRSDGLSTLEAAVEALSILDPTQDYQPILGLQEAMVARQEAFRAANRKTHS